MAGTSAARPTPPYSQTKYGHAPLLKEPRLWDLTGSPVCHILGSLAFPLSIALAVREGDCVIAADGGIDQARRRHLHVDGVIGDGDSAREHLTAVTEGTQPEGRRPQERGKAGQAQDGGPVIVLPVDKDDTDLTEAVRWGWQKGYRRFRMYGCLGGRWDHTLLNLNLLTYIARNGGIGELVGPGQTITAIESARLRFQAPSDVLDLPESDSAVGVIPSSDLCTGIDILGLKYRAVGVEGRADEPLWSSNSFTRGSSIATVGARAGCLRVVYPSGSTLLGLLDFRGESESLGSPIEGRTLNLSGEED